MSKISEKVRKIFEGKVLFRILCLVGTLVVILLIFTAGVAVGFRKASFGRAWGEHYNENFGIGYQNQPDLGMMGRAGMMGYFPSAHGATGQIIKIELPNIIVQDKDHTEKTVVLKDDTKIKQGRLEIKNTNLKINDFIIAIGTPNAQGQVEAKLIRVMPNPESLK